MAERVVVIGADAAGMSAAHQALRTAGQHGRALEVVAFEATGDTSYSACGIPYWLAGDVASGDALVARPADRHRELGVDLRLHAPVTGVDLEARRVRTADTEIGFDQLVVASGARAVLPDWARSAGGAASAGVGVLKTLADGAVWLDRLAVPGRVVVAGGGYLGVEMAEAALRRGHRATLVTRSRVMSGLEPDQSARVVAAMARAGVEVFEGAVVAGLEVAGGRVRGLETTSGELIPGDLVVLALGVVPAVDFLPHEVRRGNGGALQPDATGLLGAEWPGIWAAGDCCEVHDRVSGRRTFLPLGTHANKMGRVVGTNLAGGAARFDGVVGTAITRFAVDEVHVEISRTGLSTAQAAAAGIDAIALTTEGTTASRYMPEAAPIAITIVAEPGARRLLGAQFVGGPGAGKRVDAVAAALWGEMSIDDLAWMDLSYAPPFATAWEVTQIAARRLAERL